MTISTVKRSTEPIWLCLCFVVIVSSFYLLHQLSDLQSTQDAIQISDEQRTVDRNSSKSHHQNDLNGVRNYDWYQQLFYFHINCVVNLSISRPNTIQITMKIIYVQIGHLKCQKLMIQSFCIVGQNQVVHCANPIFRQGVKMEVHSLQSMTMNMKWLKTCKKNTIIIIMHRSIYHCIAVYLTFDSRNVIKSSIQNGCPMWA